MFFNFEPNFIEKFLWESVFSNFGHVTFFAKRKIFDRHFETKHFMIVLFADNYMVILGIYTYGASFVPKFLRKCTVSTLSMLS